MIQETATIIIKELIKANAQIKSNPQIDADHKETHNTWTKLAIRDLSIARVKMPERGCEPTRVAMEAFKEARGRMGTAIYAIDTLAYDAEHNMRIIEMAEQLTQLNRVLEDAHEKAVHVFGCGR